MKRIVITSWYYNPIHPGHIECLQQCSALGDELWVIVNSDEQARAKTGKAEVFQDEVFRSQVVKAIKGVDRVFLAIDQDGSVCASIRSLVQQARAEFGEGVQLIFGKGGDRFAGNIPEVAVCEELGIIIEDNLGAKTHHSSEYRGKVG